MRGFLFDLDWLKSFSDWRLRGPLEINPLVLADARCLAWGEGWSFASFNRFDWPHLRRSPLPGLRDHLDGGRCCLRQVGIAVYAHLQPSDNRARPAAPVLTSRYPRWTRLRQLRRCRMAMGAEGRIKGIQLGALVAFLSRPLIGERLHVAKTLEAARRYIASCTMSHRARPVLLPFLRHFQARTCRSCPGDSGETRSGLLAKVDTDETRRWLKGERQNASSRDLSLRRCVREN
jgi:hypothetical protein